MHIYGVRHAVVSEDLITGVLDNTSIPYQVVLLAPAFFDLSREFCYIKYSDHELFSDRPQRAGSSLSAKSL